MLQITQEKVVQDLQLPRRSQLDKTTPCGTGPKPWGPSTSGGDQAFPEVCAPTLQPKHERYHLRGGLAPDGRKEGAFRVINNSEEAGASKNEEARANNNEYRCHCQRIEEYNAIEGKAIRSRNARESPSFVCGGGGAQTSGNHRFGNFNPEKLEKVVPPHAGGGEPRRQRITFSAVSALKSSRRSSDISY